MNSAIERVNVEDPDKIAAIYQILEKCGQDMYVNQGLTHWRNPYPAYRIKQDCLNKEVYLVQIPNRVYVATFTLEVEARESRIKLSKLACLPELSNQGFGSKCISYIGNRSRAMGIETIYVEVYSKSLLAINFYKNKGFIIIGEAQTPNFNVFCMEKRVCP